MTFLPSKSNFIDKYCNKKSQLLYIRLPAFLETPSTATLKLQDEEYCFLFESIEKDKKGSQCSFIVLSPDSIWRCVNDRAEISKDSKLSNFVVDDQKDVFSSLKKFYLESKIEIPEELPTMSSGVFGFLGYDMINYIEDLPKDNYESLDIPYSLFIRPQIIIIFNYISTEIIIITSCYYLENKTAEDSYNEGIFRIKNILAKLSKETDSHDYIKYLQNLSNKKKVDITSNTEKEKFINIVNKAKEYIYNGDIFQVVLSQRFQREFLYDDFSLYIALRRINPSPFMFYMKIKDFSIVGASPEILARLEGDKVTVRPIAGTRPRGKNTQEDEKFSNSLLSDKKELAEHLMLLDLGRNDISQISQPGTVVVDQKMVIEYYSHVMHIVSNVVGKIKDGLDAIDVIKACFPAGTVSGAPKVRAMEIINELEEEKRSFYAGSIGYISSNGNMDICITLRTALIKNNILYVQAGAGIVADSDPVSENEEVYNKVKSVLKAAEIVDSEY